MHLPDASASVGDADGGLVAVAEVQVVQIAEAEASVRDEVAAERTAWCFRQNRGFCGARESRGNQITSSKTSCSIRVSSHAPRR